MKEIWIRTMIRVTRIYEAETSRDEVARKEAMVCCCEVRLGV